MDVDTTANEPVELSETRRLTKWLVGFGFIVLIAVVGLPVWASLTYRMAVGDLHDELQAVTIPSADITDVRIDRCWNDVAPASVRVLVPTGDETPSEVVSDYVAALAPLGFEGQGSAIGLVATRTRSDDLDSDLITVSIDDEAGRVTVVADPFDADMVTCLPR